MENKAGSTGGGEKKNTFSYAFKQQIMKAWQPVPTINSTICLFFGLSVFFLLFGIILFIYTNDIIEYSQRYDNKCKQLNTPCDIQFVINTEMKPPVFFYYELDNFYQNHRRYVKSRDVDQLKGVKKTVADLSDCEPIITMKDLGDTGRNHSVPTSPPDPASVPANPCGLIAKSFFNDSYELTFETTTVIPISDKNIAWPSDVKNKFKNAENWQSVQWLNVEDERFIVWMRTAALPNFRKLWGRIETTLKPGRYQVRINNNYDVSKFEGSKSIVLSTANAFGGKNSFLSIAYIVVGSICLLISIIFTIKKFSTKSKFHEAKNK